MDPTDGAPTPSTLGHTVQVTVQAVLRAQSHDFDDVLPRIQQVVHGWTRSKWGALVPEDPVVCDVQQPEVRIQAGPMSGVDGWAFESRHQDHAGETREWVTECAVLASGGHLELALRNSAWLGAGARSPQPSVPRLLGELVSVHAWRDLGGFPVSTKPSILQDDSDLDAFIAHALSEDRTLPLLVMSESSRRLKADSSAYLPVPTSLAQQVAGLAHVVCVPRAMHRALALELGPELTPGNGAIRVLAPDFKLSDSGRRHARIQPPEGAWAGEVPALNWLRRTLVANVIGLGTSSPGMTREVERLLGAAQRCARLPALPQSGEEGPTP